MKKFIFFFILKGGKNKFCSMSQKYSGEKNELKKLTETS